MHREVVKGDQVRKGDLNKAVYEQGYVDALHFVLGEPTKTITRLTKQIGDQ